eukprot:GILK01006489.1.p1 GENE.GILK01006489.1~~GILK01006489.1.p1  ORF type:complete len:244 (-),score=23.54 GILK01006489.1:65-796(-)
MDSVLPVLNAIGTASTVLMWGSVVPMLRTAYKLGDNSAVPEKIFLATCINCSLWLSYGFKVWEPAIYIVNTIGFCMDFSFLAFWHHLNPEKTRGWDRFFFRYGLPLVALVVFEFAAISATVLAWLAVIACLVMYSSPLQNMLKALKTVDPTLVPLSTCIMAASTSFIWAVYGAIIDNMFMCVPSVLGLALAVTQISFVFYLRRKAAAANLSVDTSPSKVDVSKYSKIENQTLINGGPSSSSVV